MSAFIVNYKTINNVLSIRLNSDLLRDYCYIKSEFDELLLDISTDQYPYLYDKLEQLGKEFLNLNIKSVDYRYNELNDKGFADDFKFQDTKPTLAQAIKSLNCLMYQSCEIENYKEDKTWQKMESLKKYLIDAFLHLNEEYKNAKWCDED